MATADKLNKLLETKKAIKDAIIEKGVEAGDVFATYPEKIKAIETGGAGADKIYGNNLYNKDFQKGDKVIINIGELSGDYQHITSTKITTEYKNFNAGFIDNDTMFFKYQNNAYNYAYKDNVWSSAIAVNGARNGVNYFQHVNFAGEVMETAWKSGYGGAQVFTKGLIKTLNTSGHTPIGSYNGLHYAFGGGNFKTYDPDTMVCSTSGIIDDGISGSMPKAFLIGNEILAADTSGFQWFKIEDDNTITKVKGAVWGTTINVEYITGMEEGDILFACNNENPIASIVDGSNSVMITYRINADKSITPTTVANLERFKTESCYFFFDPRNNVLTVGTVDNVYAYKFDRATKTFIDMNLGITDLPDKPGKYYHLFLSPDCSKALVDTWDSTNNIAHIRAYSLGNYDNTVYEDRQEYYKSVTSFTGKITGKVKDNSYEVEALLPDKVELTVTTDIDIDDGDIVFKGAVL